MFILWTLECGFSNNTFLIEHSGTRNEIIKQTLLSISHIKLHIFEIGLKILFNNERSASNVRAYRAHGKNGYQIM